MTSLRLSLLAAALTLTLSAAHAAVPAKPADGILVDADGMTLYTFDKDVANSGKSTCNGPCADLWPPLAASASAQPEGNFTVVTRDDGAKQWAHKGLPLYRYKSDTKPGEKTGDGFKSVWHVVKP